MSISMSDRAEEETANQAVFRDMNEWTVDLLAALDGGRTHAFLCECSDARCTRPISLTRSEYEAVRSEPTRFVIAVNHENPESDHVVSENARFATIEKFFGSALRVARSTDPRR